ncbi:hypothetical protein [Pseudoalteromonas rubra]|uniref:hypothetical protein n=1 Tax=Pseudoalteromonas rubra TaxID=43658 RepID=UPI002DB783B9|nr:hypothetical protein [Pseudoalteromonas rubra]MEC4091515.1 hypothetical protein [Pseudoalteromonas rubra]
MRDGRRYMDVLQHRIFHRHISGIKKGRTFYKETTFFTVLLQSVDYSTIVATSTNITLWKAPPIVQRANDTVLALAFPLRKVK